MPTDVDGLIEKSRQLKKAGGTGLQVSQMLEREGVSEEAGRFIIAQVGKMELKERDQEETPVRSALKAFFGYGLMITGAILAYKLFMGVNGWSIISTAPFIVIAIGLKVVTSK